MVRGGLPLIGVGNYISKTNPGGTGVMILRPTTLFLVPMLILAFGCGASSDDSVVAGPQGVVATFAPETANPGSDTTSMAQDGASGDTVVVAVNVTDIDGVFAATLDVTFDPTMVEFVSSTPGDLFETATGQNPIYLATEQPGAVVLGITSTGGAGDVSCTQTLVRLTFRILETGDTDLSFANMALSDALVQEIPGVSWSGGTLQGD